MSAVVLLVCMPATLWIFQLFGGLVPLPELAQLEVSQLTRWQRVFFLQDYNTRVVVIGTTLLGCAAGMVGSFTLLRKRALMGDALSHATLPGIALAFMLATALGYDGKSLPILLLGAIITGLMGVAAILAISHWTRLKEDTALAAVLSVFFGAGVAMLGIIQQMKQGHAAGLESFIYGKTASMGVADIRLIAVASLICIASLTFFFKEFKLLCFDDSFSGSLGLPVIILDIGLMSLVVLITIVGLQAVGLILVIALLVIPASAARFWTESLQLMFLISGILGGLSGFAGAVVSAYFTKLPSGATIVLICAGWFLLSMFLGTRRGVMQRVMRRFHLNRSIDRQHLLRAIFEIMEAAPEASKQVASKQSVILEQLLPKRSWSRNRLLKAISKSQREELVECVGDDIRLTRKGKVEAARLTRQHRLWEIYLITHADIAASRVDRDADAIEHVLEPGVVAELEEILEREHPSVPESPHALDKKNGVDEFPQTEGVR